MLLIFLGAPGSGKGTISQDLVDNFGYSHISTGDIFRKTIKNKTDLGIRLKELIEGGNLVDDATTWEIAKSALSEFNLNNDLVILDGYPRNINQAELLDAWLEEKGFNQVKSIYYEVPEEEILRRLTGRLMCKDCGRSFHKYSKKPKVEGICDVCKGELYQRKDDLEENVQVRLDTYKKVTEPLIEHFSAKGTLIVVDGRLDNAGEITINEIKKEQK